MLYLCTKLLKLALETVNASSLLPILPVTCSNHKCIDIKKSTDHHTISTYLNTLEPHKCTKILLGYNTPRKYIKYIREAEPETLYKNTPIMIDREKVSYNPPLSNQHWYEKINIRYCCKYSEPEDIIYNIVKARIQKPFDQYYTFDTFKTLCIMDINKKAEKQEDQD